MKGSQTGPGKSKTISPLFHTPARTGHPAAGHGDTASSQQSSDRDFALRLNRLCAYRTTGGHHHRARDDKASYYIERNANAKMLFRSFYPFVSAINNKSLILVN